MFNTATLLALLTAFSMAGGQILFKLGALELNGETPVQLFWSFVSNPFLICAIFLYAFTILIWIYVLRILPLSIAYPLTALSYVIVPVISYFFLHDKINIHTILGSLLIVQGIVITHLQQG